ncbi:hypothetical protein [Bdellovibrio sp. HCB288]|uniref:hypothetical protein n=1 Tax=Bdellovibrio sp. HCB288 TaxID=3394355 RepID=UPI0039B5BAC8
MKIAAFIAIVVFAMSSTSFAACGSRAGGSLFKNTAATTSNVAATAVKVVKNSNSNGALR